MNTKRTAPAQNDWHPADVIAALRKRNTSLRQLAIQNGYSHIQRVLTSPWLAAEQLVAKALDLQPSQVWPSRYLNPADRQHAHRLTRKIKVSMPKNKEGGRALAASSSRGRA